MIYGANGYTGRLVAELAVARGHRPVLAGRRGEPVAALAAQRGLEHRRVDLTGTAGLRGALADVALVAHCAGPFSVTAAPMVAACLATGTHYLDITGEAAVFEDDRGDQRRPGPPAGGRHPVPHPVRPAAYDLTADAVVTAAGRLLAAGAAHGQVPPGAHTPATAFGTGFAAELRGVRVSEPGAAPQPSHHEGH